MASIFNISVLAQTPLCLFLSHCLSFWPKLSQSLSRSLLDHPESCLCVLQLFPCCGLSLCYFVSAWLRLRKPPHACTHTLLPPHLNSSNPPCTVLPHIFSPFLAHALKESEKDGFCIKCRCPGWVKRAAEAMAAYRQGVSLFSLGSPTCGRSWPTWVSQLFSAKKTLCGWMLLLKPLFSVSPHTHKRPGNAAELLVPCERFMVSYSSTLHTSLDWFEVRKREQNCWMIVKRMRKLDWQ